VKVIYYRSENRLSADWNCISAYVRAHARGDHGVLGIREELKTAPVADSDHEERSVRESNASKVRAFVFLSGDSYLTRHVSLLNINAVS